jgi:hypothetical protein
VARLLEILNSAGRYMRLTGSCPRGETRAVATPMLEAKDVGTRKYL